MNPETAAASLLVLMALMILIFVAHVLDWVADTVFPEMWTVGEQFQMPATRAEVAIQRASKYAAYLLRFVVVGAVLCAFF